MATDRIFGAPEGIICRECAGYTGAEERKDRMALVFFGACLLAPLVWILLQG